MGQPIEDLKERVNIMQNIFTGLLNVFNTLHTDVQTQLKTGINKAYGQAQAFKMEYLTYIKQEDKGRRVITQEYADVSVGHREDWFAKSVECKSVTTPDAASVDTQIKKALEQVAGLTGHTPRSGDVRVIDVIINCKYNPWPFPGGAYGNDRGEKLPESFKTETLDRLKGILWKDSISGTKKIRKWILGEDTEDIKGIEQLRQLNAKKFPNSTRPIMVTKSGKTFKVNCLTIKVRFDPYYPIQSTEVTGLEEIVFQAYKAANSDEIECKIAKVKTHQLTLFSTWGEANRDFF